MWKSINFTTKKKTNIGIFIEYSFLSPSLSFSLCDYLFFSLSAVVFHLPSFSSARSLFLSLADVLFWVSDYYYRPIEIGRKIVQKVCNGNQSFDSRWFGVNCAYTESSLDESNGMRYYYVFSVRALLFFTNILPSFLFDVSSI